MVLAVEAIVPECPEESPPEGLDVGDVAASVELEDEGAARQWAWNRMEEGFLVRLWRR
jgi:hypothetical protein